MVKAEQHIEFVFRVSFLDIDLFTLDSAGRIVVGWPGASAGGGSTSRGEQRDGGDSTHTHSTVLYLASRLVIGGEMAFQGIYKWRGGGANAK